MIPLRKVTHMREFIREFKTFIARGNVLDMAVGVIVGGAFKSIADSLTNDILMPLILLLTNGGADLSVWNVSVGGSTLGIGSFLSAVLNFLIMAFAVFCLVKLVNRIRWKKADKEETPAPPAPSREELLLMEIRDLLKERSHEG